MNKPGLQFIHLSLKTFDPSPLQNRPPLIYQNIEECKNYTCWLVFVYRPRPLRAPYMPLMHPLHAPYMPLCAPYTPLT